jgi:hypothetical protein
VHAVGQNRNIGLQSHARPSFLENPLLRFDCGVSTARVQTLSRSNQRDPPYSISGPSRLLGGLGSCSTPFSGSLEGAG